MNTKEHRKILFKNELAILEGNNKRNIWILTLILALTFIGLGHSIGGLKHLKKRMDNPFTKWVNLPISVSEYSESSRMQRFFENPTIRDSFFLESIRGYKREFYTLAGKNAMSLFQCVGRTIHPDEQLFQEILKPSNLIFASSKLEEARQSGKSCWMIIKKETIERMGFTKFDSTLNVLEVKNKYGNIGETELEFTHYIPVLAIVNDLPDLADIAIPEHFNELFFQSKSESEFVNIGDVNKIEFLSKQKFSISELQPLLSSDSIVIEDISVTDFMLQDTLWQLHEVYSLTPMDIELRLQIQKKFSKGKFRAYSSYECDVMDELSINNPYYLAFNFYDLSRVRSFRDKLKKDFKFEISLNQVEDKENFSMVAKLTTLLSFLLFFISLISVLIFTGNLLLSHIERIQPNLGTFKAFGLSNANLMRDYNLIIALFFLKAITLAGILISFYALFQFTIRGHFTLLDWKVLLAAILFALAVYIIVNRIVLSRLKKTPGDLIYGR